MDDDIYEKHDYYENNDDKNDIYSNNVDISKVKDNKMITLISVI